jgi:DNA-binding response OmpR family regulator
MMIRVLLLEEDSEGRESLARVLKKRGFAVLQTGDESSALDILSSTSLIDVVIAGASDLDRLEFLADVREQRPHLPVVFLADYCGPESKLRGILYGAFSMSRRLNFYINMRPIGLTELDRLLRVIVGDIRTECVRSLVAA